MITIPLVELTLLTQERNGKKVYFVAVISLIGIAVMLTKSIRTKREALKERTRLKKRLAAYYKESPIVEAVYAIEKYLRHP